MSPGSADSRKEPDSGGAGQRGSPELTSGGLGLGSATPSLVTVPIGPPSEGAELVIPARVLGVILTLGNSVQGGQRFGGADTGLLYSRLVLSDDMCTRRGVRGCRCWFSD